MILATMVGQQMAWMKTDRIITKSVAFAPHIMAVSALILSSLASTNLVQAQGKHSCTIIVDGTPGMLRQNASVNQLLSDTAGGQAARAQIVATNGRYRASIAAPTGFVEAPNGGNDNTQFSASFSSNGATNFLSSPANVEQKIKRGTSNIEIHMKATRLNGAFPGGNYRALVTLRCE